MFVPSVLSSAVSLTVRPSIARTHDYSCIARGQPFVCEHWLDRDLLQALRADMGELLTREGPFMDVNDRMVAGLNPENWAAIGEAAPSAARAQIRQQFEELRVELDGVLDRRLSVGGVGSMAKYSIAPKGLPLGWHVDQRHEAFGQHLRLLEYADLHSDATRRSLAWLLYLSDDGWDAPGGSGRGGAMRAYPRADATAPCGAHDGNLQVGWLERGSGSEAVFLDGWAGEAAEPEGRLYCVGSDGAREVLTDQKGRTADAPSLIELLPEALRDGFCSVWSESLRGHPQHPPVEVAPRGGTLVVFDAAVVPHEVLPVVEGRRCYLGGFFSEERTVPRAWAFGRGGLGRRPAAVRMVT